MENKDTIFLAAGEWSLVDLFQWIRDEIVRVLNKPWEVQLPPNSGNAVFRDSRDRVMLDLSQVRFGGGGGGSVVVAGTAPITVTPATEGGVTTYTVALNGYSEMEVNICGETKTILVKD